MKIKFPMILRNVTAYRITLKCVLVLVYSYTFTYTSVRRPLVCLFCCMFRSRSIFESGRFSQKFSQGAHCWFHQFVRFYFYYFNYPSVFLFLWNFVYRTMPFSLINTVSYFINYIRVYTYQPKTPKRYVFFNIIFSQKRYVYIILCICRN